MNTKGLSPCETVFLMLTGFRHDVSVSTVWGVRAGGPPEPYDIPWSGSDAAVWFGQRKS